MSPYSFGFVMKVKSFVVLMDRSYSCSFSNTTSVHVAGPVEFMTSKLPELRASTGRLCVSDRSLIDRSGSNHLLEQGVACRRGDGPLAELDLMGDIFLRSVVSSVELDPHDQASLVP